MHVEQRHYLLAPIEDLGDLWTLHCGTELILYSVTSEFLDLGSGEFIDSLQL